MFEGFDAEGVEAVAEDLAGEVAEGEAGGADGFFGFEDLAGFPEAGEVTGEVVEIVAEVIGAAVVGDGFEGETEEEEVFGQGDFGGVGEAELIVRGAGVGGGGFAEDAAGAGVGVLEVGGGIALEGEHLVPIEDVIALSVGEEVGVFDGAEADDAGDLASLGFVEVGAFLGDDGVGAILGFVEEVGQSDGIAGAGFEGFAVVAEDGAEPDVGELGGGFGVPALEDVEDLAEVELLAAVGDVEDGVWLPGFEAELEGGEVGGGVVGGAIAFEDEAGVGGPLSVALDEEGVVFGGQGMVREDAEGAFAFDGEAAEAEVLDDGGQARVIEAFAVGMVEGDAQTLVEGIELVLGEVDHLPPEGEVLGVAGLEFDEFLAGGFEGGGLGFGFLVDEFVETFHFRDGVASQGVGVEGAFPADQEFAELGAPVTEVVIGDDAVAEEPVGAGEGVAEHGGPDMADVHGFGDVGGTEVDDDGAGVWGWGDEGEWGGGGGGEGLGEGGGFKAEVQEAGAGDFDGLAPGGDVERGEDLFGELARVEAAGAGEAHEGIALVIAEARVWAGADEDGGGVGVREDGADGLLESGLEEGMEHGGEGGGGGRGAGGFSVGWVGP